METVVYKDLGVIDYMECWKLQEDIFNSLVEAKMKGAGGNEGQTLLLCEHPHVYTLGRSGAESNMLIGDDFLKKIEASYYRTDRGGDITYHGPGQLVGYPILNLESLGLGLKDYVHGLEQTVIDTIAEYGITGVRSEGATGVWLRPDSKGGLRKISAIGVRSSHYVTMHGFSLNVDPRMEYFTYINPCGFTDRGVTSMSEELGAVADIRQVKEVYRSKFGKIFDMKLV